MKKLLFLTLFISSFAFGQGVRVGDALALQTTAVLQGVTVLVPVGTSSIQFCSAPANATPCSNKATTYTDRTLGTPCSTSTQVVLAGTSSCVAQSDSLGNWGVWVASGNYEWTYTDSGGNSHGPYPVTANSAPNTNAWSALTNPSANLALSMSNRNTTFNWNSNVASGNAAWTFAPQSAGTGAGGGVNILGGGELALGDITFNGQVTNSVIGTFIAINAPAPTANQLTCMDSFAFGFRCATTSTAGALLGICLENCGLGLTKPALIAQMGVTNCLFDGPTTIGHWVTVSTTVSGDCHDAGAGVPATSTIGKVMFTAGSAAPEPVWLQIVH